MRRVVQNNASNVALGAKADMDYWSANVRLWHLADIACALHMSAFGLKRTSCAALHQLTVLRREPPSLNHSFQHNILGNLAGLDASVCPKPLE